MDVYVGAVGNRSIYLDAVEVGSRIETSVDGSVTVVLYDVLGVKVISATRQLRPSLTESKRSTLKGIGPNETPGISRITLSFENGRQVTTIVNEGVQLDRLVALPVKIANVASPGVEIQWKPL